MRHVFFVFTITFCLSALSSAEEPAVERMQSVVDEVIQLRLEHASILQRYQSCEASLQEQNAQAAQAPETDVKAKECEAAIKDTAALEAENKQLKKSLKSDSDEKLRVEKELEVLRKENKSLNSTVQLEAEKNKKLLSQIDKLNGVYSDKNEVTAVLLQELEGLEKDVKSLQKKNQALQAKNDALESVAKKETQSSVKKASSAKTLTTLEKENKRLLQELAIAKQNLAFLEKEISSSNEESSHAAESSCPDDNPFPKLLMKEEEVLQPASPEKKSDMAPKIEEEPFIDVTQEASPSEAAALRIEEKASVYRLKKESPIYNAPQGKALETWEEKTSFTSNISQGDWIKITGYFVNRKWKKATQEKWIKESDTLKR